MTADQTIGTMPNSMMITTPGVTNDQPAICSDARTRSRCRVARVAGCRRWRRRAATGASTSRASAAGQGLVHLLCRAGERSLRLALAEEHRHDHRAQDLRDLRVGRELRPRLLDVIQVGDES